MMRSFVVRTHQDEEQEINITPMLDVVFIMLIFFIVTATFVKEVGVEANRPDDSTVLTIEEVANILVKIGSNNDVWINGRLVDLRLVRTNIERIHAEKPEAKLVIQPDEGSNTDTLVRVMDASRSAGIYSISISGQNS